MTPQHQPEDKAEWEKEFDKHFKMDNADGLFDPSASGDLLRSLDDIKSFIAQHKKKWEQEAYKKGYEKGMENFKEFEKGMSEHSHEMIMRKNS